MASPSATFGSASAPAAQRPTAHAAAAVTPEHAQRPTARWRLRHIDSGSHTGEGFGSHCRRSLFPLLTIACDLNQRFGNELEKKAEHDGKVKEKEKDHER